MDDHVNPMDGMRPDGDYTAAQLGKLLRLLNANYHLRGGDINTHLVLGGIRFSDPPPVTRKRDEPSPSRFFSVSDNRIAVRAPHPVSAAGTRQPAMRP